MASSSAIPINIDPKALFAPADGVSYTPSDLPRIFAQQPIAGSELPAEYLIPSPTSTLRPPTVRYGWRLGHRKLMDIAADCFPHVVVRRFAPETEGFIHDQEYTDADYKEERANIADTLGNPDFILAIQEYLDLPVAASNVITIQPLCDSQWATEWGLTVGSNYLGVLKQEYVDRLEKEVLKTEEPPMWYLDYLEWEWFRLPVCYKAKAMSKTKIAAKPNSG
ncbi:hypothetical protein K466DRAFT_589722 [Polyporus arcularius HHB13444]|uniref:Uncharacterized protein n=1 Tax=Polyporus arcularius HHB13444 TaxID=1314778 RepID=A0A5C3PC79_9APHY|nr:hypothetical protein K466DRAFT_589722 [Polyporus arcularius HHB13444]